jgi:hypothetical protein
MSDESSKPIFNPENPITVPLTVRVNIDYVPVLSWKAPSPTASDVYWREQFSLDRVPTLIARRNLCRRRDLRRREMFGRELLGVFNSGAGSI